MPMRSDLQKKTNPTPSRKKVSQFRFVAAKAAIKQTTTKYFFFLAHNL